MVTPTEQRYLCNWLSTRVERGAGGFVVGGLVVAPDHGYERALVSSRLALARALGLTMVPGAYLPPPKGGKSGGSAGKSADGDEKPTQLIHCSACALDYRSSHYHCCA